VAGGGTGVGHRAPHGRGMKACRWAGAG
jgi:hypothetical protein